MMYFFAYDIGTTSLKTCLYRMGANEIILEAQASRFYPVNYCPRPWTWE